jgi:oxygen-independent coproporphyrinogen-3 oxidase
MFRSAEPPPLALYVHLPWCVRKCPYCDFNSHAARGAVPENAYLDALLRDLDRERREVRGRPIETVFLGGGTPSLFSPAAIARLLDGVRGALVAGAEITLEANPGTVDAGRFAGYRRAGVNRLSLGVQSFDDDKLAALGRIHGRAEALRAAEAAHSAGFDNFNLDLMFGLPGQTVEQALADIAQALAFEPPHLSVYQLTLEPNTAFHADPPVLPAEDAIFEMQQGIERRLAAAGYDHYEVSAYARPGRECRHNLNYWRFGDYLGIGAGAHGKLSTPEGVVRRWKLKHPRDYLAHAGTAAAVGGEQRLAADDLIAEFMMNALRLTQGVPAALFESRTGLALARVEQALRAGERAGLLQRRAGTIAPTANGRRFLNELLLDFLPPADVRSDRPAA